MGTPRSTRRHRSRPTPLVLVPKEWSGHSYDTIAAMIADGRAMMLAADGETRLKAIAFALGYRNSEDA